MPKKAVQVRMNIKKNGVRLIIFVVQYYNKYSMLSVLMV